MQRSAQMLLGLSILIMPCLAHAHPAALRAGDVAEIIANGHILPPGARFAFRVNQTLSSATSHAGSTFIVTLVHGVYLDRRLLVAPGAQGRGRLVLAGHGGMNGHEGDLTLQLDEVDTLANGPLLVSQRLEVNGKKRGVLTSLLGLVPYAGLAAGLLHGGESTITPERVLELITTKPLRIT